MLKHGSRSRYLVSIKAEPQSDRKSLSIYCFCDSGLSRFKVSKRVRVSIRQVWSDRQSEDLLLDPTNGLHLVGVSLGAELIVVSVLALVSVSLQDVLVATVAGELVSHPAAEGEEGWDRIRW